MNFPFFFFLFRRRQARHGLWASVDKIRTVGGGLAVDETFGEGKRGLGGLSWWPGQALHPMEAQGMRFRAVLRGNLWTLRGGVGWDGVGG
jgi:hypothetical protein